MCRLRETNKENKQKSWSATTENQRKVLKKEEGGSRENKSKLLKKRNDLVKMKQAYGKQMCIYTELLNRQVFYGGKQ